ncbi:MAG TPA: glycoside hydrolase family 16 protein [Lacibacter sp.]|nr:glycoside hydrolase family 16 protein [Lacibacter sp.]HMP85882.1 glycoside hydrolase family 16 protein [Lacibacter sp.]
MNRQLVWADEFSVGGFPDSLKWSYDYGRGCPENCGWGNNELQYYTEGRRENARVEDGKLIIEAHREDYKGASYTSARLVSKYKGDWKYGRFEIRAKLPSGVGMWPAIWMLPTAWKYGGWPHSGEIDIMEFVGYAPDSIYGTVHTGAYNGMLGTQKGGVAARKDLSSSFHVYAIEWTADYIHFFIDGVKYYEYVNQKKGTDAWPFDQEFHLILNVAVGGNWGGKHGVDNAIFPQRMEIDYVRIYQ